MNKKKIDVEMADMVGKTYFKIATWFNQDFESDDKRQEALKHVSSEVIQTILEDTFLQMDGVVNTEVKEVGKETPVKTLNQTSGGTGKMFVAGDDPITRALRASK
jgi:alpha-D-ribose 1-methylphosphonate 5-triphosphate synthase subunit PhnG